MELVSVIMPAYRAEAHIGRAVQSVLAQTYPAWELLIVADDHCDYAAVLAAHGISDARIRYPRTGNDGSGTPAHPRNIGLQHARGRLVAWLDSDDCFTPEKLERCLPHVIQHSLVTSALSLRDQHGALIRELGPHLPEGRVPSSMYKRINPSGDTIFVYDRERIPVQWDRTVAYLEDLEVLLQCFTFTDAIYFINTPLHLYFKSPQSWSGTPAASQQFIATKHHLIARIESGYYRFKDPQTGAAVQAFLRASLAAEQLYMAQRAANPNLIFEDVIGQLLAQEEHHAG
ncbi:MAG: glycosyltransferase family 2 protein [Chloroflexaceae bacterium]|nr:glycosyltransferase family 2 protein [Chloroflexaceae bacterium]